jgi:integrase
MGAARVDLYLGYASQLFKWAKQNYRKDIEINPFEGLQLGKKARKRPDTQRDAFSIDDLKKIFVDSCYFGQDKWDKAIHPHFFWIPLLGLYTGAREEELGQLYVDNVKEIEGLWVLDISDNRPGQSVKTDEQRLIPLHDLLQKKYMGKFRNGLCVPPYVYTATGMPGRLPPLPYPAPPVPWKSSKRRWRQATYHGLPG